MTCNTTETETSTGSLWLPLRNLTVFSLSRSNTLYCLVQCYANHIVACLWKGFRKFKKNIDCWKWKPTGGILWIFTLPSIFFCYCWDKYLRSKMQKMFLQALPNAFVFHNNPFRRFRCLKGSFVDKNCVTGVKHKYSTDIRGLLC